MKLDYKYGQAVKFGDTIEVMDHCYAFEKKITSLDNFFNPLIEKQAQK